MPSLTSLAARWTKQAKIGTWSSFTKSQKPVWRRTPSYADMMFPMTKNRGRATRGGRWARRSRRRSRGKNNYSATEKGYRSYSDTLKNLRSKSQRQFQEDFRAIGRGRENRNALGNRCQSCLSSERPSESIPIKWWTTVIVGPTKVTVRQSCLPSKQALVRAKESFPIRRA